MEWKQLRENLTNFKNIVKLWHNVQNKQSVTNGLLAEAYKGSLYFKLSKVKIVRPDVRLCSCVFLCI